MRHSWAVHQLVAIDLPAGDAFLNAMRSAWDSGDAVLPLTHGAPLEHRHATAVHLGATEIVDAGGLRKLHAGWEVRAGDALVMATSGSTGEPKGAVLTHEALEYSAFAGANALGVASDVHWLACLPLSHIGGLSVITRAWHTGAALSVHDGFAPDALTDALAKGATHVSLVPTALRRIDPAAWRCILLGGSAIPEGVPSNCVTSYGMTETAGGVVYDGQALNGVQVRIAGASHGQRGLLGPIELRTPTLARCYRLRDEPVDGLALDDGDGWFRTGDIGMLGTDDRLEVRGRADELIISGGENVWPAPVEAVLEAHPSVAEAAVLGAEDPDWGQRVCAVVVASDPTAPPTLADLRSWVRERLPTPSAPKQLELRTSLPRTALGKLRRSSLRSEVVGGDGGDDATP